MERRVQEEWLDFDRGSPPEIDAALRSIGVVNRLFGGNRLHQRLIGEALASTCDPVTREMPPPSILEVASGHGAVLQAALLHLQIAAEVTLLDQSAQHLPDPAGWPPVLPKPRLMVGNALDIPLADATVDVVSCCLFLHHLEPPQVMRFLKQALRVARVAVVINDLERTRMHVSLANLFSAIDRSRISRHDGPASVRRAYTGRELTRMLTSTGRRFSLDRHFLYRLGAIVWKDDADGTRQGRVNGRY